MDTLQKISPAILLVIAILNIMIVLFAFFGNLATKSDIDKVTSEMNRRTDAFERRTDAIIERVDRAVDKSHAQQLDHVATYHLPKDK